MNLTKTMSSREIAALTGKRHSDVLEAIRNMEAAWVQVSQRKFPLAEYTDEQGKTRPMYNLSKTECLYVSTKFNDEARARVILRWEELEQKQHLDFSNPETVLMLAENWKREHDLRIEREQQLQLAETTIKQQAPKVQYHDRVLQSEGLFAVTQVAADLGISAIMLNRFLAEKKWQFKVNGCWTPAHPIKDRGYFKSRTFIYMNERGEEQSSMLYYFTQKGRKAAMELYQKSKEVAVW